MELDFFNHPYWPLLMFGFLFCPRILLVTLWYPIRGTVGELISYPLLALFGTIFVPRFTLACIFAGYYWSTNKVTAVVAFFLSMGVEFIEKSSIKRYGGRVFFKRVRIR